MDFLLDARSDDEESDSDIQRRLLEEMAQYKGDVVSQYDDKSVLGESMLHIEQEEENFNHSQAWKEFQQGNQQRDKYLEEAQERITQMKLLNKADQEQEIELDDDLDYGKKTKIRVQPRSQEQINEVKKRMQELPKFEEINATFDEAKVKIEQTPKVRVNQNTAPKDTIENSVINNTSKPPKVNRFALREKQKQSQEQILQKKKEQMEIEREMMQMELEDQRSMEYEKEYQNQLFILRNYQLPSTFPSFTQQKHATPKVNLGIVELPTFTLRMERFQILPLTEENLAPKNSTQLVKFNLQKFQHSNSFVKPKYSDVKLLINKNQLQSQTDTESKQKEPIQLIFGNELPFQMQPLEYSSERELMFFKIHQQHQQNLNFVFNSLQQIQASYIPYRVPFTTFENFLPTDVFMSFDQSKQSLQLEEESEINRDGLSLLQYHQANMINLKTKCLEVKMEGLTSLQGIQLFQQIKQLQLSSNKLRGIATEISACQQLIEVNLAQNQITDYSMLGSLRNLRSLILEMNYIHQMSPLKYTNQLEYYNLSGNQIQEISNLDNLTYLKRLTLFRNQIKVVQGLENLHYLEELDLGSNQINSYTQPNPFAKCFNLRKLYLYNNNLRSLPQNLSLIFLTHLWVQQNGLENLEGLLYLPSLTSLQVQDNQITQCISPTSCIPFMPVLMQLNLSRNKLSSFGSIHNMLRFSNAIEKIDYSDNPFVNAASANLRALQTYMLMSISRPLKQINQNDVNWEDFDFLKSKFLKVLDEGDDIYAVSQYEKSIQEFHQNLKQYTQSFNKLTLLATNRLHGVHEFVYTELYKQLYVLEDMKYLQAISKNGTYKERIISEILKFEKWHMKSLWTVKSFLIKWIYKTRKRNKWYRSRVSQIIKAQALTRGWIVRRQIKLDDILSARRFNSKAKFAIKIQRRFRQFCFKRRRQRALEKVKYVDKELDEMEEFDDDFFNQPLEMNYDLKIPDGMDIGQIFGQQIQMQQRQQQLIQQAQQHQKPQQQTSALKNNFLESQQNQHSQQQNLQSSSIQKQRVPIQRQVQSDAINEDQTLRSSKYSTKSESLPSVNKNPKIQEQKIMDEWGFTKPEVAHMFAMRLQKNAKRKQNSQKKTLTAEQRLQQNFYKKL